MPNQSKVYRTFKVPVEIHLSISLLFDPQPGFNNDLLSFSKKYLYEGFAELEKNGFIPQDPPLLNNQTGEYIHKYISEPVNPDFLSEDEKKGGIGKTYLLNELTRFIVHLTYDISKGIEENKTTLDILTDFATIIGVAIPITKITMRLLHLDKKIHKSKKDPSVIISIGNVSVTVIDEDLKDAKHAATNIARKLLKEHPEALPSTKVSIQGKLTDSHTSSTPPKSKQTFSRPQRKPHKKRRK